MNKKILIYIGAIIIVIITGVIYANKIFQKAETMPASSDVNDVNNMVNTIDEEAKNKAISNINVVENENSGNDNKTNNESKEEKAKKIVQENWGEDDTVYYSYDGIDANGRYIICVREKSTTKALYWYYVDIETGTFDIE